MTVKRVVERGVGSGAGDGGSAGCNEGSSRGRTSATDVDAPKRKGRFKGLLQVVYA